MNAAHQCTGAPRSKVGVFCADVVASEKKVSKLYNRTQQSIDFPRALLVTVGQILVTRESIREAAFCSPSSEEPNQTRTELMNSGGGRSEG